MSTFPHPPGTVLCRGIQSWIVCSVQPPTGRTWTGDAIPCDFTVYRDFDPAGRVPPHLLPTAREWMDRYRLPEGYDPARHDLIWSDEKGWDWDAPGAFDLFRLEGWILVSRAHSGRPEPACDAQPASTPEPPHSGLPGPQNAPERPLEGPAAPARPWGPTPIRLGSTHPDRPGHVWVDEEGVPYKIPAPARPTDSHPAPGWMPGPLIPYDGPDPDHWIFAPTLPSTDWIPRNLNPKENPMFLFRLMKFAPKASAWLFIGWLAFGGGGETVKNHVVEWWTSPTPLHLGAWTRVTTCDSCQHVLPAEAGPGGLCPSCGGESFSVEKAQELTEEFWNAWPETGAAWWDTRVVGWAFPDGTTRTTPGHWRLPSRSITTPEASQ